MRQGPENHMRRRRQKYRHVGMARRKRRLQTRTGRAGYAGGPCRRTQIRDDTLRVTRL
jgi:hypothetical protein